MSKELLLAPSILNADFLRLGEEINAIESGGAHWIHLDIMDGCFVPNISFGPDIVANVRRSSTLPMDCHLMINQPERFIPNFLQAGCDSITVQVESTNHLDRSLQMIKQGGARAAVTLNPATPLQAIEPVLDIIDMVLVMAVNPGFGGQSLIPYCLDKISKLRAMKPELDIQVDGGIKLDNINEARDAGANIFVVGSAIYGTPSPKATTQKFIERLNQ